MNGDWDKLSPGARLVLSESGQKLAGEAIQGYKAAIAAQDTEGAQKFLSDYQFWNNLAQRSVKPAVSNAGVPTPTNPPDISTPEGAAYKTQQDAAIRQQESTIQAGKDADESLVNSWTSNFEKPRPSGYRPNEVDADIYKTLQANPKWTTSQKAEYIRKVNGGPVNSPIPKGATTAVLNGKNIYVVNNKWVYADGTPVQTAQK